MTFGTTVYRRTHPRSMHVKCYVHLLLLRVATSFLEDVLFKSLTIHSKKCLATLRFLISVITLIFYPNCITSNALIR